MEVLFNNIFTRYYVLNFNDLLNAKVIKEKACEKFLEIPNIDKDYFYKAIRNSTESVGESHRGSGNSSKVTEKEVEWK
jgi:hypothetical protein